MASHGLVPTPGPDIKLPAIPFHLPSKGVAALAAAPVPLPWQASSAYSCSRLPALHAASHGSVPTPGPATKLLAILFHLPSRGVPALAAAPIPLRWQASSAYSCSRKTPSSTWFLMAWSQPVTSFLPSPWHHPLSISLCVDPKVELPRRTPTQDSQHLFITSNLPS
jgi:hypothetical protein